MKKQHVSKIEAAERQITQAIRLFFARGDAVSIHTIAAAAVGILNDVATSKGQKNPIRESDSIYEDKRKKWLACLNASANFFKHADRDPFAVHEFNPEANETRILEAVFMLGSVAPPLPWVHLVYLGWFSKKHPDIMFDCEEKRAIINTDWDVNDFEFFERLIRDGEKLAPDLIASINRRDDAPKKGT